jgi:hypothetical protein
VNELMEKAKSLIIDKMKAGKRDYVAMKGIENWAVNIYARKITHKSGIVFTFERGVVVDIDLKGISTKELR